MSTPTSTAIVGAANPPAAGDASTTTVASSTPAGSSDVSCIVGSWKTTDFTNTLIPNEHGVANVQWTLSSTGAWAEHYDGSTPLTGGSVSISYSGVTTGTVRMPTDPSATTGVWSWTNGAGTIVATISDGTVRDDPFRAAVTGTWTCNGNTMTVVSPGVEGGTDTVQLARNGS